LKKFALSLLLLITMTIPLAGCSLFGGGRSDYALERELIREEIAETVEELDEIVAYMGDNFFTSARVRIRDISVWERLGAFYEMNPHILIRRGISGMSIEYSFADGVIDAVIFPEYEIYKNIIVAHELRATDNLPPDEKRVYDTAQRIVAANKSTIAWETAHALHTYLMNHITFEHQHAQNPRAFNVHGALIDGRAVCQGYAQAYRLLLHLAGIESIIVTGRAGGEYHAWNLVNYGSQDFPRWYHVDVTWNDREEIRSNRYFNVSDAILAHTHSWESGFFPPANSTQLNYFRYRGVNAATAHEVELLFESRYRRGVRTLEILCTFPVTGADLAFLSTTYGYGGRAGFAITPYGNDYLLTISLP
jgi:hypothetical protein